MKKMRISQINSKKQLVIGSILSYALIILDLAIALFLPKWINNVIGQSNYGVYTLSTSLTSMVLIDFGLGAAATSFLSKIRASNNKNQELNLLGIIYKLYFFIDILISIVYFILFFIIDKIYVGLTTEQIRLLKTIFPIIAVYNLLAFPFLPLEGSYISHEQFIIYKGLNFLQKILYTIIVSIFLVLKFDAVFISIASVISGTIILVLKIVFARIFCNFRPNFKYKNKVLTKQVLGFSVWISIAIVASKLISSLMPTILGIVSDANNIAVYGYAYALECNAFAFSTVVSTMVIPNVARLVKQNGDNRDSINQLAIKVGRIQMAIIVLFLIGFVTFGKEFLLIIMDRTYLDAYYCFLLLFLPNLISAAFSVCEKTAHILNNVKYISIIQLAAALLSLGFSFLLGRYFGAIGVSISYCAIETIGIILIIILVYGYKQKMKIYTIFMRTFIPYLIPSLVSAFMFVLIKKYYPIDSLVKLVLFIFLFALVYLFFAYCFSLNFLEKFNLKLKVRDRFDKKRMNYSQDRDYVYVNERYFYLEDVSKVEYIDANCCNVFQQIDVYSKKYGHSSLYRNIANNCFAFYEKEDQFDPFFKGIIVCNSKVYEKLANYFKNVEKVIVLRDNI